MLPALFALALAQPLPPNVIYIMADDLGYGELGCYGQEKIKTPNIDRLAKEGVTFTRFYSASTVCAPTRTSLMTGKHTGHSPIRGNKEVGGWGLNEGEGQMSLPASERSIAEALKERGYATGIFGKWGMGGPASEGRPTNQGFDTFFGFLCQRQAHNYTPTHLWQNDDVYILDKNTYFAANQRVQQAPQDFSAYMGPQYAPAITQEKAEAFIRANKSKPFFLYYATTLPHAALQAPKEWVDKYPREWDAAPYLGQNGYLPCERPRATYAAMISYLDDIVGRVTALVEELGLSERTLIVFTGDNGVAPNGGVDRVFFNSTGGLKGTKTNLYEGGIREPFVARWRGTIMPGSTNADYWASYDVFATVAELCGANPPESEDGVSFAPTLLGKDQKNKHSFLYFEYPEGPQQQAIIGMGHKLIFPNLKDDPEKWECYRIEDDPNETDNQTTHYALVNALRRIAKREHVPNKDFPIPALDNPKP